MLESSGDFVDKPSFEESLRALSARRRSHEGHPTAEELVAYRAGELSPEEDDRIKEHLTQCHDCARLLLDLAEFEELPPPPEEIGPVDARAEASWQRLRSRLREEEGEAEAPPPMILPRRTRVPVWQKPALPWALAAGLALCVMGLGWRAATLQKQVGDLSGPRVDVPILDLYPESELTTRGGDGEAEPVGGSPVLIINLPQDAPAFEVYEMEVVPAAGGDPLFVPQRGPAQDGSLTLQLPPASAPAGSYAVQLYGLTGGRRQLLDRYLFEISPAAP